MALDPIQSGRESSCSSAVVLVSAIPTPKREVVVGGERTTRSTPARSPAQGRSVSFPCERLVGGGDDIVARQDGTSPPAYTQGNSREPARNGGVVVPGLPARHNAQHRANHPEGPFITYTRCWMPKHVASTQQSHAAPATQSKAMPCHVLGKEGSLSYSRARPNMMRDDEGC
ncbi:hypothetical protein BP6252_01688 [Coleophoma cylindrospora]|uniref:Uncharacterized protein n=1 Tax=Coleophoma cylindrospora TaxID=1849047 RepID=A0A3D8STN1_9HELO|nr:hypothetical protein BP6252_01688 [Coleophoma cylindrospora]